MREKISPLWTTLDTSHRCEPHHCSAVCAHSRHRCESDRKRRPWLLREAHKWLDDGPEHTHCARSCVIYQVRYIAVLRVQQLHRRTAISLGIKHESVQLHSMRNDVVVFTLIVAVAQSQSSFPNSRIFLGETQYPRCLPMFPSCHETSIVSGVLG